MKSKQLMGAVALLVAGMLFGALLISGFGLVRPGYADINLGANNPPVNLDADATAFSKAFIEVAEKVTPTIVRIGVVSKRADSPHEEFFFFPFRDMPREQAGSGSGIIISEDGYILTNNHVVENATNIQVDLFDKRRLDAKVIGRDPLTDLAVIKINASDLPVAFLGDSDGIKVGQWVMAIGNPLSLSSTVTAGIVSAVGRGSLNLIRDSYGVENFIQTDAAINPGNSGGALVDLSGSVIGVNSAIAASRTGTYIGYGFAIPINLAQSVAKDLIAHGKINRGYIGVNIEEVNQALAKSLGLDRARGVIIQQLVPGGAASQADIREGDVILSIDGREINQANELQSYVASRTAGTKVTLVIFRDGREIERSVTLKPREEETATQPIVESETPESKERTKESTAVFEDIGMTVRDLTAREKREYKLENGVMITEVKDFSRAAGKNLAAAFVITEADRKKVNSASELKNIINSKKGEAILLRISDASGNTRFVGLDIPE
jgi:serine protease Do